MFLHSTYPSVRKLLHKGSGTGEIGSGPVISEKGLLTRTAAVCCIAVPSGIVPEYREQRAAFSTIRHAGDVPLRSDVARFQSALRCRGNLCYY